MSVVRLCSLLAELFYVVPINSRSGVGLMLVLFTSARGASLFIGRPSGVLLNLGVRNVRSCCQYFCRRVVLTILLVL